MNSKILYMKNLVCIIQTKIANELNKATNIWYQLKLVLLFILIIFWGYFFFINPYVIKSQMDNNAAQKESDIMYLIHSVSPNNEVKYFGVTPIIGGDRIFIVRYMTADIDSDYNKAEKAFVNLGWEKGANDSVLRNNNFSAVIKYIDKTTLQITIACIETKWGDINFVTSQLR